MHRSLLYYHPCYLIARLDKSKKYERFNALPQSLSLIDYQGAQSVIFMGDLDMGHL